MNAIIWLGTLGILFVTFIFITPVKSPEPISLPEPMLMVKKAHHGETVEAAVVALRRIGDAVGVITDMNMQIASAAEEQSSVADEINRNVTSIRDVTESISGQAQESSEVGQALNRLANQQQKLMDQFRV